MTAHHHLPTMSPPLSLLPALATPRNVLLAVVVALGWLGMCASSPIGPGENDLLVEGSVQHHPQIAKYEDKLKHLLHEFGDYSDNRESGEKVNELEEGEEGTVGEKRAFQPWGGKRAFQPWGGKRNALDDEDGEYVDGLQKRYSYRWGYSRPGSDYLRALIKKGFQPWGGKRTAFQPWGGKRSVPDMMDAADIPFEEAMDSEKRDSEVWSHESNEEKRAFQPWGGKRAFQPWGGKRAFQPWGGKRAFQPWGGKRAFQPWGGKRAFQPWGGKRSQGDVHSS